MTIFIIRRLLQSAVVLLGVSLVVFLAVYAIGDPLEIMVPPEATPEERAVFAQRLGLDLPLWLQYFNFLSNALQGDFGHSFIHSAPVLELIFQRLPATLELVFVAMIFTIGIGIPLGLVAGFYHDRWIGKTLMGGSAIGFSVPNFWQGMALILIFAVWLGWLQATGRGSDLVTVFGIPLSILTWSGWGFIILPALNLAISNIAIVLRLTAAGVVEAKQLEYVRFARAKGVRKSKIVGRHILPNIMIPIVTMLGVELGTLIAFSTITEKVFSWPGVGNFLIQSILLTDRPVIVAYVVLITFLFIIVNLVVDILYAYLDPRIQLSEQSGK